MSYPATLDYLYGLQKHGIKLGLEPISALLERLGRPLPPDFDPHKPHIDALSWPCRACNGTMRRVPEVIDCWFDSGCMPFAQHGYPHQNRELFAEVMRETFPGTDASPALRRHLFAFQWRLRLRQLDVLPGAGDQVIRLDLYRAWARTRDQAKAEIRSAVARAFITDFITGSPMQGWLSSAQYSSEREAYRLLGLANTGATRACLEGSTGACGASLGFGFARSGEQLAGWYTSPQRREMVGWVARQGRIRDRIERDDHVLPEELVEQLSAEVRLTTRSARVAAAIERVVGAHQAILAELAK